ncbi:MAG: hypothetical protein SFY32_11410 [Bacteroidota bacterium]|nr:hypothetical protein [Bacteroidota bacterium]
MPSIKVDITKAERKRKSQELKDNGTGDHLPNPKEKDQTSNTTKKIGFVDRSKQRMHDKADEIDYHATGDIPQDAWFNKQIVEADHGIYNATDRGVIPYKVLKQRKASIKASSYEMGQNKGDIEVTYHKTPQFEKDRGKQAGTYQGKFDQDVLNQNKSRMKASDAEMGQNQGDIDLTYKISSNYRKDQGKKMGAYSGTIDASVLTKAKSRMKATDREMGQNQGDIIGSYIVKRNRERDKNKEIANYSGKIDIKSIQNKAKENSHRHAIHRGDILVSTAKARESGIRSRARKMSDYRGEIIVTSKRKGTHPSSEYRGGMMKNSYAEKEKLRKQKIKQARKNRSKEDPEYMRKKLPKPRYETEEYKIWESRTRGE